MSNDFSGIFKTLRKEKYLTQEQIAELLGVSPKAVSRWENSATYPDVTLLPKIAEFLGTTVDGLLGVSKTEKPAKGLSPMLGLHLNRNFTAEEKESGIEVIRRVVVYATMTRRNGVLSLEKEIPGEQSAFMQAAIRCIVDSCDPVFIEKLLNNLILAENYSGTQLLERLLIMEGMLLVQQGYNPWMIAFNLLAILGEGYLSRVDEVSMVHKNKAYAQVVMSLRNRVVSPVSVPFEETVIHFSNYEMQRVIREIDQRHIADAIHGCGDEVIYRFLDNMSENMCASVCEDLLRINSSDDKIKMQKTTQRAQDHIQSVIEALLEQRQIVRRKKED
jgi:transcriptional regulator with XRE-family HTH domain